MPFQQSVRDDQASGIIGEFAFDGPQRAFRYNIVSAAPANNVFGRAFTIVDDTTVQADGGGSKFAGILVSPKQHALLGDAAGTLSPSLVLPNNAEGDMCTMGQVFVDLLNAGTPGDSVAFNNTTGELTSFAPGAVIAAPQIQILGAQVVRCAAGPGLAIIELTHGQAVSPTA